MVDKGPATKPRFTTPDSGAKPKSEPMGADAVKRLFEHVGELREYAAHLAAAKADQFRLKLRGLMAAAVLGVIGLLIAFGVIFIAVWQVLTGIAGGLDVELLHRPWLANLITGTVFLSFLVTAMLIGLGRWKSASKKETLEKYEHRKRSQQSKFGRDVEQAARADARNARN